jgi:hypothetical protein
MPSAVRPPFTPFARNARQACRTALAGAALAAALFAAPAVHAQSDADRATARDLGLQGFAALDAKDFKTAEDNLRRADSLVHAPTLLLGLARALAGQHKYVEAQECYQRIIREGVAPGAPEAFRNAVESAKTEVSAVAPLLGGVTITVTVAGGGEAPTNEKVTVDGNPINVASLGIRRAIDPGPHLLKVTADGFKPAELQFNVTAGAAVDAPVTIEKDPNYVAPSAPPGPGGEPAPGGSFNGQNPPPGGEQPQGGGLPSWLPWAAFGVGGAGLVLGGVTGAIALGDHSSLQKACPDPNNCNKPADINNYHAMGTVSTVGFIVGGVGAGAGLILLLTQPRSSASMSPAATPASGLHVTPVIGLGSVGAIGTF